jgi:molybdate transport system substrate-binding protein
MTLPAPSATVIATETHPFVAMPGLPLLTLVALCSLLCFNRVQAGEIRVAVASNFAIPMQEISGKFEQESPHEVTLIPGSTGKHYAQIVNGAPFDVFFAADRERPALLEQDGHAVPGSRFTYALGRLVLWSPDATLVDDTGRVLDGHDFRRLAIANPRLAPYGRAAQQVLEALGLWQPLQARLVRGENIAQAFQFVASGNAELGFVALSQVVHSGATGQGSSWRIPVELHAPIEQQAVLLTDKPAASAFMDFVQSDRARAIIRSFGYETP